MKPNWRELNREQDQMLELLKHTKTRLQEMTSALTEGGTVTMQQLRSILPGQPFTSLEGIRSHRVPSNMDEVVMLYVDMQAGSYFRIHDHDCFERILVLHGECFINDERCHPMKDIVFKPKEKHRLFTRPGCGLLVVFREGKPA
jgi:anti-sigma factor ChrR (cupin superfamily)